MKKIYFSTQYKKDFKRYKHNIAKVQKILDVLRLLERDTPLPPKYKAHKLIGNYQGCMECHIESDLLLVWIDEDNMTITVLRLGSHAELFRI